MFFKVEQDPNHLKVPKRQLSCIGLSKLCVEREVNNLFTWSMGWKSCSRIFEIVWLVWVVTLCGWFIGTIVFEVWVIYSWQWFQSLGEIKFNEILTWCLMISTRDLHQTTYWKEDNINCLLLEPSIEYYFGQPL